MDASAPHEPGLTGLAAAVRETRPSAFPGTGPGASRPDALASLFEAELRLGVEEGNTQRAYEAAAALWRRTGDLARCHGTIVRVLDTVGAAWAVGQGSVLAERRATAAAASVLTRLRALTPPPQSGERTVLAVPPGDRHTLALESLAHLLEHAGHPVDVVGDLPAADLVAAARGATAVLLSVHVPPTGLRALLAELRRENPDALLILGGPAARRTPGADLVTGDLPTVVEALRGAGCPLSDREREVLRCVADGLTNPEAAEVLGVAPATFKTHLDNVFAKLGTTRRAAAVAIGLRRGWID
jgi:DNA-binding NarL/FixJ family response regulator